MLDFLYLWITLPKHLWGILTPTGRVFLYIPLTFICMAVFPMMILLPVIVLIVDQVEPVLTKIKLTFFKESELQ